MFQFRFEALLIARRHVEEGLQKELAEARRALAEAQSALRDKKAVRRRCLQEQLRAQRLTFRGPDMLLFDAYLRRLGRDIETLQKQLLSAERKAQQKRYALMEAVKKRKMIEKLKEKDHEKHLKALAERERKFLDEAAARVYTSQRSA